MDPRRRAKILEKIESGRATRSERLILKQEGLCFYCWTDLEKDVTKEHLHSRALGGSNSKANLRVAHMKCNGVVGSLPVDVKLELHEIGRDKGPDAFWARAREYQEKYGKEKKAYASARSRKRELNPTLRNANLKPTREETHDLSSGAATIELEKMHLGESSGRRRLSRAEKSILFEEEILRRERTGLPVRLSWREFFRELDRRAAAKRLGGSTPLGEAA